MDLSTDYLLPDCGIKLTIPEGDVTAYAEAAKFIKCFRSAWRQIPVAVRRRLLAKWLQTPGCPAIKLQRHIVTHARYVGHAFVGGYCTRDGKELAFSASEVCARTYASIPAPLPGVAFAAG